MQHFKVSSPRIRKDGSVLGMVAAMRGRGDQNPRPPDPSAEPEPGLFPPAGFDSQNTDSLAWEVR